MNDNFLHASLVLGSGSRRAWPGAAAPGRVARPAVYQPNWAVSDELAGKNDSHGLAVFGLFLHTKSRHIGLISFKFRKHLIH